MNSFPFVGSPFYGGHLGSVGVLRFSPDGSLFASAGTNDETVRLWRTATGEVVQIFRTVTEFSGINSLVFSPDGKELYCCDDEGYKTWDIETGKRVAFRKASKWNNGRICPNRRFIATTSSHQDNAISIRDFDTWKIRFKMASPPHENVCNYTPIGFSEDGNYFLAGDGEVLQILNLQSGELADYKLPYESLWTRIYLGQPVILQADDAGFRILNIRDLTCVTTVPYETTKLGTLDGTRMFGRSPRMVCVTFYRGVSILNLETGEIEANFPRKIPWYRTTAISPDDSNLLISDDTGAISLFRTSDWQPMYTIGGSLTSMDAMALDPTDQYLVSLAKNGKSFLWDIQNFELVGSHTGVAFPKLESGMLILGSDNWAGHNDPLHERSAASVLYIPIRARNRYFPTDTSPTFLLPDGSIFSYVATWNALRRLQRPDEMPSDLKRAREVISRTILSECPQSAWSDILLSQNGRWVVLINSEIVVQIDTKTGSHKELLHNSMFPEAMCVSNDSGDVMLSVGLETESVLHFNFDQMCVSDFQHWPGAVTALSPDGRTLKSGDSYERWIRSKDIGRKKNKNSTEGHSAGLRALVYTSDGKTLISSADDGQIILWDAKTMERKATLIALASKEGEPTWIAFTPDGKWNGCQRLADCFVTSP